MERNILVTGFKKFGDYSCNCTEQFLGEYNTIGEFAINPLVLPAHTFADGAEYSYMELAQAALASEASAVISLGMASDVQGLRIETCATNWSTGKYCLRSEQNRRLNPRYSARHIKEVDMSRWDIELIRKNLKELDIKFEDKLSTDAENFCCNALMYRTLFVLRQVYNIPFIFLHIPCSAEAVSGMKDFNKKKDIITMETLHDILTVFSMGIK